MFDAAFVDSTAPVPRQNPKNPPIYLTINSRTPRYDNRFTAAKKTTSEDTA